MTQSWLILADDLTGAADCAIAFARRGRRAVVSWGEVESGWRPADVVAYDTASRGLPPERAAQAHRQMLGRLSGPDRTLFKKIDSTLRGEPAIETAVTAEFLRAQTGMAFGVFAPAFPSTGRTTIDGHVHVAGRPLEEAEVWRRDHTYASADLVEVLASADVVAERVPLAIIRRGSAALRAAFAAIKAHQATVAVCDAETDQDLHLIAEASLPGTPGDFFIGSAGLAHALAARVPGHAVATPSVTDGRQGALIVVGSLAATSRSGARKLVAGGEVVHVPVTPDILLSDAEDRTELGHEVARLLDADADVLVEIQMGPSPDMSLGPRLAAGLAAALEPAADRMSAFAATGGETAAALLSRFGVNGIELIDEIEPGVALGFSLGRLSIPVVTKAGAFGDENSLGRIAARLRAIRKSGIST
ncbi:Uncharacterized conserved protein YgbK, DUF1537 family [Arboricoccus pini]|uniref:Uncharacterized conserved protein YgbK, DUF1537 family n=1 Tax=Arboricoccus pini TaxID=1963835 RepID=A0A212RF98_9PROT|nr:four-carbon acid sugar kinase family protein [Arboricoccus pini]SNB70939.1 Uncharacterized conserved protein YgbK, DUF1537 family [Arboricoccus pini]